MVATTSEDLLSRMAMTLAALFEGIKNATRFTGEVA